MLVRLQIKIINTNDKATNKKSSFVLVDSFVLRNPPECKAPKRCAQSSYHELQMSFDANDKLIKYKKEILLNSDIKTIALIFENLILPLVGTLNFCSDLPTQLNH
jgi:hypothetical protein